ncbi:MAG: hypothetical protein WBA46_02015 [Thermomicrobiales bacterium]
MLLLVICVGLGWFVGVPRLRDGVSNSIEHGIGTEISQQFSGASVPAGEYTLDLAAIAGQMRGQLADAGVDSLTLRGDGSTQRIYLGMTSRGSDAVYSGIPTIENGKLVMTDMTSSNNVLGFFIPPSRLGDAIETGVNSFFAQQGLQIVAVTVQADSLIVQTAPAS